MSKPRKQSTTEIATELVTPIVEKLGLELWDVRFEKEGAQWYLRYYIDKPGGIQLDDCEAVSREVSQLLDEKDPISQNYILEVGSPGLDRFLNKDEHFQAYLGEEIEVRLIRPVDNRRNFKGTLVSKEGSTITMELEDEDIEMVFEQKEAAFVRLYVDFETGGKKR